MRQRLEASNVHALLNERGEILHAGETILQVEADIVGADDLEMVNCVTLVEVVLDKLDLIGDILLTSLYHLIKYN